MKEKTISLDKRKIEIGLTEQLFKHRQKLGLKQTEVAGLLSKSESTYQRWESTGKTLTNVYDILALFQVLDFSTTEIIGVLGLSPLTLSEVKEIYQDEDTRKSIKENTVCSYMHDNCQSMTDFTIDRLIDILFTERLKRRQKKH